MLKYRNNVAGFIVNDKNQVLLVQRARNRDEAWQIPQGGVDDGETEDQAIKREMKEEIGTDNFKILGTHEKQHVYDWPEHARLKKDYKKRGYKGQSQTIFYLLFLGGDDEIKVDGREHNAYRWVSIDDAAGLVQPVRQKMAKMAVAGYKKLSK